MVGFKIHKGTSQLNEGRLLHLPYSEILQPSRLPPPGFALSRTLPMVTHRGGERCRPFVALGVKTLGQAALNHIFDILWPGPEDLGQELLAGGSSMILSFTAWPVSLSPMLAASSLIVMIWKTLKLLRTFSFMNLRPSLIRLNFSVKAL